MDSNSGAVVELLRAALASEFRRAKVNVIGECGVVLLSIGLRDRLDATRPRLLVFYRAKRKCGQCPHFLPRTVSYTRRTAPDSACFRLVPVFSSPGIPFESHLGQSVSAGQRGFCI